MKDTNAYLNGDFLPLAAIQISPLDRGFLFGDGVYEVIPAFHGRLFKGMEHLERLEESLSHIRLAPPFKKENLLLDLEKLAASSAIPNQSIYVQVTRGTSFPRKHAFPNGATPTLFAYATHLDIPPFETLLKGVKVITRQDPRWHLCHIKGTSLLPNILLYQEAMDNQAFETILLRDGNAMEACSSNIFIIKDGVLVTPPISHHIIGGVTRKVILALATSHGLESQEKAISLSLLQNADELWLCGSTKEIVPAIECDQKPIGSGCVGPYWKKMYQWYQASKG